MPPSSGIPMPPSPKPGRPPSPKPGIPKPPQPRIDTLVSPQQTVGASVPVPPPGRPPPKMPVPTWQVSGAVQAMHAQLESLFGTQPMPGQQDSPSEPPMPKMPPIGAVHARPEAPQVQLPPLQSGAFGVQTVPQPPQFAGSAVVSVHVPAQQAWPLPHAAPLLPQTQEPATQLSPIAQAWPIDPQLFGSVEVLMQRNEPPSFTQASPGRHWSKSPHMQRAVPAPPPGTEQELARVESQAMPQPLQFAKEGSERPSLFGATDRWMHEPPQQRCVSVHSGEHIDGGGVPLSVPGGTLESMPPPPHIPMNTQVPSQHSWVAVHAGSQSPDRPPPAHPGNTDNANAPSARTDRIDFKLMTASLTESRVSLDAFVAPQKPHGRRG